MLHKLLIDEVYDMHLKDNATKRQTFNWELGFKVMDKYLERCYMICRMDNCRY
jgi:hypothetical protein